ncbi:gamma carbonic anhydrase family protein [Nakamurella sp. YIM 132087]|uniref:Gamma carbonic anhydrase family protein n=1 Tax=Nakamurella alba TaxID=2665158 RepID=A0A7K1FU24_9ACTN|nr:gamma carbonic anhydrase family protein [Nakamurella alba]MTD16683.1 gamma carbonic anhydrase family protein [Nakamurella alba]
MSDDAPRIITFGGITPAISDSAWIAPGATVIGRVTVGDRAGVLFGAVVRADRESIDIGPDCNLQDGVVVHADPGFPARLGRGVSVGHRAVLHGCTVDDRALIGMGAVVLNGAHIGAGAMVAAGAVVLEGTEIPPGSLAAGVPAKVRRELTEAEQAGVAQTAERYVELVAEYAADQRAGRSGSVER